MAVRLFSCFFFLRLCDRQVTESLAASSFRWDESVCFFVKPVTKTLTLSDFLPNVLALVALCKEYSTYVSPHGVIEGEKTL